MAIAVLRYRRDLAEQRNQWCVRASFYCVCCINTNRLLMLSAFSENYELLGAISLSDGQK